MAHRSNRRTTSSASIDPEDINFWTTKRLQDELTALGVNTPGGLSKSVLRSLYLMNKDRVSQTTTSTSTGRDRSRSPVSNQIAAPETQAAMTPSPHSTTTVRMSPASTCTAPPTTTTHHCACANALTTTPNNAELPFTGTQIPVVGNNNFQQNITPLLYQRPTFQT